MGVAGWPGGVGVGPPTLLLKGTPSEFTPRWCSSAGLLMARDVIVLCSKGKRGHSERSGPRTGAQGQGKPCAQPWQRRPATPAGQRFQVGLFARTTRFCEPPLNVHLQTHKREIIRLAHLLQQSLKKVLNELLDR